MEISFSDRKENTSRKKAKKVLRYSAQTRFIIKNIKKHFTLMAELLCKYLTEKQHLLMHYTEFAIADKCFCVQKAFEINLNHFHNLNYFANAFRWK
jgi:hypothetical protein